MDASDSRHRRWRLILNGKSAADEIVRESVMAIRGQGIALDVRVTWEAGDGHRHVIEALEDGIDILVAGGGDGTLSEVAAALAGQDAGADGLPALALLPLGTANDFATAAQVPLAANEALQLVQRSPARPIDLLRIRAGRADTGAATSADTASDADPREHWCANLASGGFGTRVTVETDEGLKKVLGGLAYLITGIARLGRIEPIGARLHGPDFAWQGNFIALGIGNGRQAGAGQVLCPDALIDDGRLDLTIVPEFGDDTAATLASVLTTGRQGALERIAVRQRLPWLQIDAARPMTLNLDGEPVEASRFRIDCIAHRLRMHLPPDCPLLHGRRRNG